MVVVLIVVVASVIIVVVVELWIEGMLISFVSMEGEWEVARDTPDVVAIAVARSKDVVTPANAADEDIDSLAGDT